MTKPIQSLNELRTEISVLKSRQRLQEEKVRKSVKSLAESVKPANLVKNAIKSFGSDKNLRSDLTLKGAEAAVGFLVSNLLLRNFGPAAKIIASLAGTTVATSILGDHAGKYIDKFKNLFNKFTKMNAKEETGFDEKDIYGQ